MSIPPLATCAACKKRSRALVQLKAGLASYKCVSCGDITMDEMPALDKMIIYLDQLAISQIFKIKTGTYPSEAPHHAFWTEVTNLLQQGVLLQQVLCPASDIHRDESMVFTRGDELTLTHEMLGGDTSFRSSSEIEGDQVWAYLRGFVSGKEPILDLSVDSILDGHRNEWLSRLHISAAMDWTGIAKDVRDRREMSADNMVPLYERWRADPKTSFKSVLKTELESFGSSRVTAYLHFAEMARRGLGSIPNQFVE